MGPCYSWYILETYVCRGDRLSFRIWDAQNCRYYYFAGHVNVAPRHLTAEAETLLSATLIHEVCYIFWL